MRTLEPIPTIPTTPTTPTTTIPTTLPPQTPTPPPITLRRLNVAGIARKEPAKTGKEYPIIPDPNGQLAIIVARILERAKAIKALESPLATDKADLTCHAIPAFFTANHGRLDPASGILARSPSGDLLVSFTQRYPLLQDAGLAAIRSTIGPAADTLLRYKLTLEIDGDAIPAERAQALCDELRALMSKHGCDAALKIADGFAPAPDLHARRHTALTPDQNCALHELLPCTIAIKSR